MFDEDDIAAAMAVLRDGRVNYWTGDEGRRFEQEFSAWCGARYGLAVANGSLALELSLYAVGIGAGDEVVVTARSFVASASAVLQRGARPVFADVDPDSQNLTAASIARVLTPATRAVIVVHLAGWPAEMAAIRALAEARGLRVIEDCAQAHGAIYRGQRTGSMGCAGVFSFCHEKSMTTGGEGGMLLTSDPDVFERARSFRDHGTDFAVAAENAEKPGFSWSRSGPGSNLRLTEMQSAIGRRQLLKLPAWLRLRARNAAILRDELRALPALRLPAPSAEIEHGWYKFYAFVDARQLKAGWDRDRLLQTIGATGVPCSVGACPEIYRESVFCDVPMPDPPLLVAPRLGQESLMFCVHPTLTSEHMRIMAQTIARCVRLASS